MNNPKGTYQSVRIILLIYHSDNVKPEAFYYKVTLDWNKIGS